MLMHEEKSTYDILSIFNPPVLECQVFRKDAEAAYFPLAKKEKLKTFKAKVADLCM